MQRIARHVILLFAVLAVGVAGGPAFAKKKKKGADPATAAFVEKYGSDDAKLRSEAVESLRKTPDATKFEMISTKVIPKEKRADVLSRAVGVLQTIREEAVVEKVVAATTKGKTDRRVLYVEALSRIRGEASHRALLSLIEDKEPLVRGMAAYGLGQHQSVDALEPLMGLLDDRYWQVQAAALAAIPRLSDKAAVKAAAPRIVDFMENVSGRMRDDAADSLRRILGRRLGRKPAAWRKLIAGEEVAPGGGDPTTEAGAYGNQAARPHFYGMEVTSNRVVLILDMSLSMNDVIEIDKDRLRRETSQRKATTGKDAKNDAEDDEDTQYDIPWWRIKTRLDLAREQTILLVSQLREEQHFDIIIYSTDVNPWMGRLVPATSANKQKAMAMLKGVKPDDKTNTWGAIAKAFDLAHNHKKSYQEGPDEMYLVTDGAPSAGDITDPDQILEATIQLWKLKQIKINVIGIGVNLPFLRKMARATGGQGKFFTN